MLAHAYNRLGHVLNCADDAPAAIVAHRRALDVLRGAGRCDLEPEVLIDLGYTLWGSGALEAAEEALRSGRAMLEEQGRRDERGWAHATAGLGMVEQDAGRLDEAVAHQRAAIAAFTEVLGADHPDTAQTFDKLGYALRLQGKVAEAIEAHQRGVRLLERVLGPDDSRVGMALTNLGLALADAGAGSRPSPCRAARGRSSRRRWGAPTPARCWPASGWPTHSSRRGSRSAPGRSGPRSTTAAAERLNGGDPSGTS